MWSKRTSFAFFLASLALFVAFPVFASTITVTTTSDSGSGTLRAAIAAAAPGDTIAFNLTYPATITVLSPLVIAKSLTISGPGATSLAISGGNAVGVFQITAGTVSISGLTIENGFGDGGGGPIGNGLYNNAIATVTDVTFTGNSGGFFGGGIYNKGTLTVIGGTLTNNSGNYGGGIVNEGTASFTGSTLSLNFGSACGGAVYNNGTITLSGSTVSNNGTDNVAGGICNDGGTLTVSNSTISGNGSVEGGGIMSGSIGSEIDATAPGPATLTITGSTITGNHADIFGGGINASGTVTITNSTISGNHGGYGAGGVVAGAPTITNSTITGNSAGYPGIGAGIEIGGGTVKNTILAGNFNTGEPSAVVPLNCSFNGAVTSGGHNLSDDTSCADFFNGVGDLNNTPPGLDPAGLKNNGGPTQTIALVSGLAVYSIPLTPVNYCTVTDGVTPVATDQRGVTRPQSPQGCSIGAFEPQAPSAYAQLQALYSAVENQIAALPPSGKADRDKDDRRQLKDAAEELAEMLNSKNWAGNDGDHLVADRSFRFFDDDREAAEDLSRILHDHDDHDGRDDRDDHKASAPIPSQEIQTDLASLSAVNRLLATTAIAGASTKHPDLIARAKDKLADGDAALAGGNYERAIDDYQRAWSLAENVR